MRPGYKYLITASVHQSQQERKGTRNSHSKFRLPEVNEILMWSSLVLIHREKTEAQKWEITFRLRKPVSSTSCNAPLIQWRYQKKKIFFFNLKVIFLSHIFKLWFIRYKTYMRFLLCFIRSGFGLGVKEIRIRALVLPLATGPWASPTPFLSLNFPICHGKGLD